MLLSVICIVLCVILTVILLLALPKSEKPQDPKNWWEQRDKVLIVLEDERTIEKSYSYHPGDDKSGMVFNYIYDKNDTNECIPILRVFYDGVEIKIYTSVVVKKRYNDNQERYNSVSAIKGIGVYSDMIHGYLTEEDAKNKENDKFWEGINIIIN